MPEVLRSKVDVLSRVELEKKLSEKLKAKSETPYFIVTANAEMYYQAAQDAQLQEAINSADLCLPDSVGIAWALKRQGEQKTEVYPGVELAQWLLQQADSVYVLGAREEILQRLKQKNIVGKRAGFFKPTEETQIITEINNLKPDVVLVALGAGRQELWIARNRGQLKTRIIIGIGGAIDVISGAKRRAPSFWRKCRLEWLYRLIKEPWRFKRQLNLYRFWRLILKQTK